MTGRVTPCRLHFDVESETETDPDHDKDRLVRRLLIPNSCPGFDNDREGYPCRLYFDVEFETEANPDREGDRLVGRLVDVVIQTLKEVRPLANPNPGLECPLPP